MQKEEFKLGIRIEKNGRESEENRKSDPPRALRAPGRAALGARAHTRTSHTHTKTGWDAADTVASALSRPLPPPKPSNILSPRVFVQEGVAERAVPRGRRQHRRGDSGGLANHEYRVVRGTHGSVIPGIIAVDTLSFGFTPPLGHGTSTTA